MRRLALIAAFVTASTSVASADPPYRDRAPDQVYERDRRPTYREGYYDRGGRRLDRYDGRRRWEPLAERTRATTERQVIDVGGRGRFRRLLVESVRGAPVIERVAVEFGNRQTQVWEINARLPRGADEVIDLGGHRRIHRIVVYTNPAYRGVYSIYGT